MLGRYSSCFFLHLSRQYRATTRSFVVSSVCLKNKKDEQSEMEAFYKKFTPVYKLPSMGYFAILSRLKISYAIGVGICSSACFVLDQMCVIDPELARFIPTLGVVFGIALFGATYFTNRLVGFIYLAKEGDIIIISYLNFWGRRINQEIPIDDLMAMSDLPSAITDRVYVTLRRHSNTDTFKFNAHQGIILDKDKFQRVFGTEFETK